MELKYIIACLIIVSVGLAQGKLRKWQIDKRRWEYDIYHECIRNLGKDISSLTVPIKITTAIKGSTLVLPCFPCLNPEEEDVLEDMWKPKETYISRKIQSFVGRIKAKLRKFWGTSERRATENESHLYTWQKYSNGSWQFINDNWIPLIRDASKERSDNDPIYNKMFQKTLDSLINKPREELGDHFELIISNVSKADEGWYRCVHMRNDSVDEKMQTHRLEVFTALDTKMIDRPPTMSPSKLALGIELRTSTWTQCNRCNVSDANKMGERRREHRCYITKSDKYERLLIAFGSIPCSSRIIDDNLRNQLDTTVYEEYQQCNRTCPPPKENDTLTEYGWLETGEKILMEKLGGNEFSFSERLPMLHQKVERTTFEVLEGDQIVMDCSTDGLVGIVWKKDEDELTDRKLQKLFPNGRVFITGGNQLVLRKLELSDSAFYSCAESPEPLLRTWVVKVSERVDKEYIVYVQIVFRFLILILLLYLFFTFVMRMNERLKRRRVDDIIV